MDSKQRCRVFLGRQLPLFFALLFKVDVMDWGMSFSACMLLRSCQRMHGHCIRILHETLSPTKTQGGIMELPIKASKLAGTHAGKHEK